MVAFVWLIGWRRQQDLLLSSGAQGGACWLKEPMGISNIQPLSSGNTGRIHATWKISDAENVTCEVKIEKAERSLVFQDLSLTLQLKSKMNGFRGIKSVYL